MGTKFLKIFTRRSTSKSTNKDQATTGILLSNHSSSVVTEPKQKKQKQGKKKLSKRQLKKQKKKDRKAAFPSSNGGGQQQNYVGGNLVTEQTAQITQARDDDFVPPPPTWEPEKENVNGSEFGVDSGGFPTRTTSSNLSVNPYNGVDSGGFPTSNNREEQLYQDSFGMNGGLYDIKPALSMIVEEKSPRNAGVASPRNGSASASPRSAHSSQQVDRNNSFGSGQSPRGNQSPNSNSQQNEFGRDEFVAQPPPPPPPLQTHTSGGSAPQAQQIMSPTHLNSGMKPPLTPNRGMGGPGSSSNSRLSTGSNGSGGEQQNNLTPSQYRSPQPPSNNSSRLNQFNNPNNSPGNSMSSGTSNSGLGINGMTIETNNSDTIRQSMSPDDQSELRGMRLATADSADMCLSADSADEEYNRLRSPDPPGANATSSSNGVSNNGVAAATVANKGKQQQEKFVSALDRSPFSYSGEEDDNALFPALVEDKDPWNSNTSAWPKHMTSQTTNQTTMETQEDIRAWTPQASSSKKGTSFTFDNSTQPMFSGGPMSSPAGGKEEKNLFEMNFADFEPFDPSQQFTSSTSNATNSNKAAATQSSSSKSVAVNSSPVSALLEDSRARRKSRESSQRSIEGGGGGVHSFSARNTRSGGSINSAPALNASQIRSTIRSSKGHHYNNNGSSSSISRVIDNLELHVNKRQSGGLSSTRSTSARSQSSASGHSRSNDGTNAIREAKERIRRENMMNNESKMIDMLAAGGSSAKAASAAAAANSAHEKKKDDWLFDEVAGTLGPRSVAADLESLGGRSGKSHRSSKSHRSHRSKKSSSRRHGESSSHRRRHRSSRHHDRDHRDDGVSVDSRTSRNSRASYRSYQTTKSMVSQMSEQSRSVANDLLRLEAQLSMVGKSRNGGSVAGGGGGASTTSGSVSGVPKGIGGSNSSVISKTELNKRRDDCGMTVTSGYSSMSRSRSSRHHSSGRSRNRDHISASARRAAARTLRSKVTVKAPPGKLGIILANRTDSRGTVVSGVRTSSVLAEQVSPGDRIIAIDDEDVSQMNVKEITTIMARKSEFERVLVLLAAPKVQYD